LKGDALAVGHGARLDPVKNQALLIDAFTVLRDCLSQTVLLVLGVGPLPAELEARIASHGLIRMSGNSGWCANPESSTAKSICSHCRRISSEPRHVIQKHGERAILHEHEPLYHGRESKHPPELSEADPML
jgi:hypothetical protein